jgi:glycosyltransferase involved in cell wall biosynthesis
VLILAAGLQQSPQVDSVVVTGKGTMMASRLAAAGVATYVTPWGPGLDPRVAMNAVAALRPGAILHAHDSHSHALADALSRMRRTPIVVTRRVTIPIKNPQRYRRASAVIAISQAVRELLLRAAIPEHRIHLVHDAVDIAHVTMSRSWPESVPHPPAGTPLIAAVAALTREKGVGVLLEAAALVRLTRPEARWIVLGEGPERDALAARSTELGIDDIVNLAGFVMEPEAILRHATIAVQPSLSEGLGSSVLDALALGVPVVATSAGGLPEALAHGGGVLVPPGSPRELATAVEHLLSDEGERGRLAAAGPAAAAQFGIDQLVRRTLDVYRSVAQTQGT